MGADSPVGVFSSLTKWCKIRSVCTDNSVFRLHYRATVLILLAFFLTITTKQFVGEPMKCLGSGSGERLKEIINSFCWIHGTHTVREFFVGKIGKDIAHPGVGPGSYSDKEIAYHLYYQWVYFLLPLQAMFFYAPHVIWKMFEGNRVKGLTEELDGPLLPEKWTKEKKQLLAKYLVSVSRHTKNMYAYQFAFCELLNFVNSIGQIFLTDIFLGGNFARYGVVFWNYQFGEWNPDVVSPMDMIFPKVSTCRFLSYGPSAGLQNMEFLCVLPLNVIHEKVFLFLWFWFIMLSVISGFALAYRLLVFSFPCIRAYSIIVQAKLVPKYHIYNVIKKFSVSDWFVLNQIGKNMNVFAFKDLVTMLGEELEIEIKLKDAQV